MQEPDHVPRPLRLARPPSEAAQALGCNRDFFDKHIGPELRWVRRGRLKFVAIAVDPLLTMRSETVADYVTEIARKGVED
jgi:hypothetical protein